jgi:hypothetical protein
MCHDADNQRGKGHSANRQLQDDAQIGAKIPPDRKKRARHQQRRQEQHQRQIGIEPQIRRAGNQRQHHPADDQGCGRRQMQSPGRQLQGDHNAHQRQDKREKRH